MHSWTALSSRVFIIASIVLVFAAHLSFGANTHALSMIFASATYLLCGLAFAMGLGRDAWSTLNNNRVSVFLFTVIIVAGLWQLTPFGIGGPHPLWAAVDKTPAITLDRSATLREVIKIGAYGVLFVFGAALARDKGRVQLFFSTFMIFIAGYLIWAYTAFLSDPNSLYGIERPYHKGRLAASFLSANSAATLFGTFAILASAKLFSNFTNAHSKDGHATWFEKFLRRGAVPGAVLLFSLTCLSLTASRAGIAVSITVLLVFFSWGILRSKRFSYSPKTIFATLILLPGVLAVIVALSGRDALTRYLQFGSDGSANTRLLMFDAHWQAFLDAPFFGHGLGTFSIINQLMATLDNWGELSIINATHNVILQCLEEGGLIIAVPMIALLIIVFSRISTGLRRENRMRIWSGAILAIGSLTILHGQVDYALQVPSFTMQWTLLLGVGVGLTRSRS